MNKGIGVFLALALAAGAGGGVFYQFIYREHSAGTAAQTGDGVYVNSVAALAGLGSGSGVITRYAGMVEPQQTSEIKLASERTLEETYVKQGDTVKVGDKLFKYSTKEDEDKLAQDEIDLERSQNEIENKKRENEQLEKRASSTRMSEEDQLANTAAILANESAIKSAEYDIKSKELEISQLKEKMNSSVVTSDLEGVVKSVSNPDSTSSFDSSSSDAYITIMEVGRYRVKGTVNEQNRMQISPGDDVLVYSRTEEGRFWRGSITEIQLENGTSGNSSEYMMYGGGGGDMTSSTSYPFYVQLENSDDLILGQHVYIELDKNQEEQKDGIWLPDYYFETDEEGAVWVWAAKNKSVLERRRVELGEYDEGMATYEVISGLTADDYIVQPSADLRSGLPVILIDTAEDMNYFDDYGYGGDPAEWEGMEDMGTMDDTMDPSMMDDTMDPEMEGGGLAGDIMEYGTYYGEDMDASYEIYNEDGEDGLMPPEDDAALAEDPDAEHVYMMDDEGNAKEIISDVMTLPEEDGQ